MELEDFNPTVKHIAGEKNLLADALSRLEMKNNPHGVINWEPPKEKLKYSSNYPNHELVMWMNSLKFEPGYNNKRLYELTEETESAEEVWPLNLCHMQRDQLSNDKFQKELKILMK